MSPNVTCPASPNFQGKIKNAEDKKRFPVLVNNVAFVKKKTENGEEIKYTYLRKQFKLGKNNGPCIQFQPK